MKVLVATDGSPCSDAVLKEVCTRTWPAETKVKVISVAHPAVPVIPDPFLVGMASHYKSLEAERKLAAERASRAAQQIREQAPQLEVSSEVLEESPKKVIVEEAERWGADLILVGSHGYGPVKRFLLGSVSHAVALHAHCSVEVVRQR